MLPLLRLGLIPPCSPNGFVMLEYSRLSRVSITDFLFLNGLPCSAVCKDSEFVWFFFGFVAAMRYSLSPSLCCFEMQNQLSEVALSSFPHVSPVAF